MKIIIDTSVLISFALKNEKAIQIFNQIENGAFEMFTSPDILFEYKNVLRLRKLKFSPEYQLEILNFVGNYSKNVIPDKEIKFSRDKFDSPFLSLANHIEADVLFTQDKTLLKADHLVKSKILSI